jgi:hypothetical protein
MLLKSINKLNEGTGVLHRHAMRTYGSPQSLHASSRIVPQIGRRPFPSKSSKIHYSLIILAFDTVDRIVK